MLILLTRKSSPSCKFLQATKELAANFFHSLSLHNREIAQKLQSFTLT
jgi:hypothetical protein